MSNGFEKDYKNKKPEQICSGFLSGTSSAEASAEPGIYL